MGNLMEVLVCIVQHGRDTPSEWLELCHLRILRLQFKGDVCFIMSPKVRTTDYENISTMSVTVLQLPLPQKLWRLPSPATSFSGDHNGSIQFFQVCALPLSSTLGSGFALDVM